MLGDKPTRTGNFCNTFEWTPMKFTDWLQVDLIDWQDNVGKDSASLSPVQESFLRLVLQLFMAPRFLFLLFHRSIKWKSSLFIENEQIRKNKTQHETPFKKIQWTKSGCKNGELFWWWARCALWWNVWLQMIKSTASFRFYLNYDANKNCRFGGL